MAFSIKCEAHYKAFLKDIQTLFFFFLRFTSKFQILFFFLNMINVHGFGMKLLNCLSDCCPFALSLLAWPSFSLSAFYLQHQYFSVKVQSMQAVEAYTGASNRVARERQKLFSLFLWECIGVHEVTLSQFDTVPLVNTQKYQIYIHIYLLRFLFFGSLNCVQDCISFCCLP